MKTIRILKLTTAILLLLTTFNACIEDESNASDNPNNTKSSGEFTDARDGKVYKWVKIGDQIWMAENLAYKPANGSDTFKVFNNDQNNISEYGYLYSWDMAKTVAPAGWRLPDQKDWEGLVSNLGGKTTAYTKMVEKGTKHWNAPNNATNESGFTALPAGYYDSRSDEFNAFGHLTMFHSATEYPGDNTSAIGVTLNANTKKSLVEGTPKALYKSVRCIKVNK